MSNRLLKKSYIRAPEKPLHLKRHFMACVLAGALAVLSARPAAAAVDAASLSYAGRLPAASKTAIPWARDPFIPPQSAARVSAAQTPAPNKAALRLTAVFYSKARPSAIINDRIVYRESLIDGQKVVDIGRTHVILQGESGRIRLEISDVTGTSDVRKTP